MALLKKKAGRMCYFCHKAWKGMDFLVYLPMKIDSYAVNHY